MTAAVRDIADDAAIWVIRTREPDFAGWVELLSWLEADPQHLAAYEAVLAEDEWLDEVVADSRGGVMVETPALELAPSPAKRRLAYFAIPGAVAAVLVGAVTWTALPTHPAATEFVTEPGEHRSFALADGSRVEINGASRLTYDAQQPRMISLESGEAVFRVRHDAAHPFVVKAGGVRLIDAGTEFNVVHEGGRLEVAVAEGAVIYDAGQAPVRLDPGEWLRRAGPGARIETGTTNPGSVGSWRKGLLQYDDAALSAVARDLSRTVGSSVHAGRSVEDLRYTGTLAVDGPADDVLSRIGPLLGVTFRKDGDGWEMMPRDAAIR
ncbi:FecR family protein [Novosphingobium aquimarinum]|uniref:FecR family protein n=1 Tax=Novosphingobium aquimarinum TaxID=2682494 RepID=UPI0012EB5662|nr:FecR domain-containing protein [Novosphingobium aquimarinum]